MFDIGREFLIFDEVNSLIPKPMKQYTHAWLAFMAIKRLDLYPFPENTALQRKIKTDAAALVRWFKSYRDFVIEGSWYPDMVFKDMATSHIIKYYHDENSNDLRFKKLPSTMKMYKDRKESPRYGMPFSIECGNLADRCEAMSHDIVDCLKMLRTEERGCPISPTNNHIAMRFFIQSHYIADCHMPLHCDRRPFSSGKELHAKIEEKWDDQIRESYRIDKDNNRFYYDPDGYPLHVNPTPMVLAVEKEIAERKYIHDFGEGNSNTWDYMSAVSQYSYLRSFRMIPEQYDQTLSITEFMKNVEGGIHFDDYSVDIFSDAVESIAHVWLRVWMRYRDWQRDCKMIKTIE